jgi:hypothetical protein
MGATRWNLVSGSVSNHVRLQQELTMNRKDNPRISAIPGLAIIGLLITGIGGWVHQIMYPGGIGLIAAAIAFGTLLYVSFR